MRTSEATRTALKVQIAICWCGTLSRGTLPIYDEAVSYDEAVGLPGVRAPSAWGHSQLVHPGPPKSLVIFGV